MERDTHYVSELHTLGHRRGQGACHGHRFWGSRDSFPWHTAAWLGGEYLPRVAEDDDLEHVSASSFWCIECDTAHTRPDASVLVAVGGRYRGPRGGLGGVIGTGVVCGAV